MSYASNLTANDNNGFADVFVRYLLHNTTQLVSINLAGDGSSNGYSDKPLISADGNRIAFTSGGTNLSPLDTVPGVYVRDLNSHSTQLVSVTYSGLVGPYDSSSVQAMSANGNVVLFASSAPITDSVNPSHTDQLYARDLTTGTTTLVNGGQTSNDFSYYSSAISADGRYIAYDISNANLPARSSTVRRDVYLRDTVAGTTILVSRNITGTGVGDDWSGSPMMSADGRVIAYCSDADDLVSNDTNFFEDVFAFDVQNQATELVSRVAPGLESVGGNGNSFGPAVVSADGRYVAFVSDSTNLIAEITIPLGLEYGTSNVYRYDRVTGKLDLVSVNAAGTGGGHKDSGREGDSYYGDADLSISADGSVVVFPSWADDLVQGDTNHTIDVFARNFVTNTTYLVSVDTCGTSSGNGRSSNAKVSADGRTVVFQSNAKNLTHIDVGYATQIYARDLLTGTTELVSWNAIGTGGADGNCSDLTANPDCTVVAFTSEATNLDPLDSNSTEDVFARNLLTGTTYLVSENATDTSGGNSFSARPQVSADGNVVAFASGSSDLDSRLVAHHNGIYARNLVTGHTQLVTINATDTDASVISPYNYFDFVLSTDGSVVAFTTWGKDLGPTDTDNESDVYARNLNSGAIYLVSNDTSPAGSVDNAGCDSPAISDNGNTIAFVAEVANEEVLVRHLSSGQTELASPNMDGKSRTGEQYFGPTIAMHGQMVAFTGITEDLVRDDYNNQSDVFISVLSTTTPALVGDFNLDTNVDAADFVTWRKTANTMIDPYHGADGNGNGVVNQDDYAVWRASFGRSLPASGPELDVTTQPRSEADNSEVTPAPIFSSKYEPATNTQAQVETSPGLISRSPNSVQLTPKLTPPLRRPLKSELIFSRRHFRSFLHPWNELPEALRIGSLDHTPTGNVWQDANIEKDDASSDPDLSMFDSAIETVGDDLLTTSVAQSIALQ